MTRTAIVVAHGGRPEALVALRETLHELAAAGFEVVLHDDHERLPVHGDLQGSRHDSIGDAEIVVVLGGDGTILRAAELTRGTDVPILGVNLGHVGFLAEAEREDLRAAVHRIGARDYKVEERGIVEVSVRTPQGDVLTGWALNEATVEKADRERMIEVVVAVDGRPLSSFGCDGVIVATATGSTAHAFSGGGPVVWPDVDAMLLVPLAAHALFARPLVVGPRSAFAIEVVPDSQTSGVLTLDGRRRVDVAPGSRIEVTLGTDRVRLARLSHALFSDRLVNKFDLPVVGWRGAARASAEHRSTTPVAPDQEA